MMQLCVDLRANNQPKVEAKFKLEAPGIESSTTGSEVPLPRSIHMHICSRNGMQKENKREGGITGAMSGWKLAVRQRNPF